MKFHLRTTFKLIVLFVSINIASPAPISDIQALWWRDCGGKDPVPWNDSKPSIPMNRSNNTFPQNNSNNTFPQNSTNTSIPRNDTNSTIPRNKSNCSIPQNDPILTIRPIIRNPMNHTNRSIHNNHTNRTNNTNNTNQKNNTKHIKDDCFEKWNMPGLYKDLSGSTMLTILY
ncbi:hypothetical protein DASC09_030970 [Saccharomycopsis crataegensis]|uniref:Uncharacterized protein n=1 Tax=Saccharomycopsis crataegensis TaxID=43959 RepID=A0AAV5QLV9_9ASCO|nr:hypothetical protein DASC09_030970 [Saccharomycopsis crataegensis]